MRWKPGLAFAALASCGALLAASPGLAAPAAQKVDDFTLSDQMQKPHELYGLKDSKLVVLVTQMDGCPIVRNVIPALKELRTAYAPKGVTFLMLNSSKQDTRDDVAAEAKEYNIDFPILLDTSQAVGKELGVKRTAEVIVIQPKTWQVVYHGPVDDRVSYGRQKAKADHPYAANALDAALAGKPVAVAWRDTKGCLINFE
jgi:peroxiredoxin